MNPTPKPWSHLHPFGQGYLPLQDDQIHYAGQPVVLVIANTPDQAAYAGTLVKVEYDEKHGQLTLRRIPFGAVSVRLTGGESIRYYEPGMNPAELASRLTGLECEAVTEDGSPRGEKLFALWNPPFVDEEKQARDGAIHVAHGHAHGVNPSDRRCHQHGSRPSRRELLRFGQ